MPETVATPTVTVTPAFDRLLTAYTALSENLPSDQRQALHALLVGVVSEFHRELSELIRLLPKTADAPATPASEPATTSTPTRRRRHGRATIH